jgi:hypothetical protein
LKDADCARLVPPLAEKAPGQFAACIKEPSLSVQSGASPALDTPGTPR